MSEVRYRGSPYHKRHRSKWGPAQHRSDKSLCPTDIADAEVERVLEAAIPASIARGWVSLLRDGTWPRYVWGRSAFWTSDGEPLEVVWEARVENHGVPEYKAYPVQADRHADHMPFEVWEQLWPR